MFSDFSPRRILAVVFMVGFFGSTGAQANSTVLYDYNYPSQNTNVESGDVGDGELVIAPDNYGAGSTISFALSLSTAVASSTIPIQMEVYKWQLDIDAPIGQPIAISNTQIAPTSFSNVIFSAATSVNITKGDGVAVFIMNLAPNPAEFQTDSIRLNTSFSDATPSGVEVYYTPIFTPQYGSVPFWDLSGRIAIDSIAANVPESGTAAMMVAGIVVIGAAARLGTGRGLKSTRIDTA
jgi:hypothetical protein